MASLTAAIRVFLMKVMKQFVSIRTSLAQLVSGDAPEVFAFLRGRCVTDTPICGVMMPMKKTARVTDAQKGWPSVGISRNVWRFDQ